MRKPTPWIRARELPSLPQVEGASSLQQRPGGGEERVRIANAAEIGAIGYLHELRPAPPWTRWRVSLAKLTRET